MQETYHLEDSRIIHALCPSFPFFLAQELPTRATKLLGDYRIKTCDNELVLPVILKLAAEPRREVLCVRKDFVVLPFDLYVPSRYPVHTRVVFQEQLNQLP